jgi:cysteine desulfurase/selenocysteine lyase
LAKRLRIASGSDVRCRNAAVNLTISSYCRSIRFQSIAFDRIGAALDYVETVGMGLIGRCEHELLVYATEKMLAVPGLKMIGTAKEKASVLSFVLDGCRTQNVGTTLDREGIAVRAGHHCAQPILRRFGLESTVRPSLAFYNTYEDVDVLVATLLRIQSGRGYR